MADSRDQDELAVKQWSELIDSDYFDSRLITDISPLVGVISLADVHGFGIVPLLFAPPQLEFGFTESSDRTRFGVIKERYMQYNVGFHVISKTGFDTIANRIELEEYKPRIESGLFEKFEAKLAGATDKEAFGLIAQLAYELGASDIHIEPQSSGVRLRLRIDGVLHPITTFAESRYRIFLSDLQTRAGLKWGTTDAQSGRIADTLINKDGVKIEVNMRIETLPTFHGEEIVVRIFNMETRYLQLDNMGLTAIQRQHVDAIVAHPHGMVLSVGPTGSGKTSTLYSIVNQLNNPETKIVTLEDPIEYDLAGVSQIPVHTNEKESFAEKLRAVLRQDPNVVMIGEIRDVDTAKTALQASLTGHLVLSTFHASSAAAAITRLMDMIGQNPLLASAIRLIMAQRLVRRVCSTCKVEYAPDAATAEMITSALTSIPTDLRPTSNPKLYRGKGCNSCHNYGYLGRVGLIEQLLVTPAMEALIASGTTTATLKIEEQAKADGMITLYQDGLLKVLAGLTTLEEVNKVADIS